MPSTRVYSKLSTDIQKIALSSGAGSTKDREVWNLNQITYQVIQLHVLYLPGTCTCEAPLSPSLSRKHLQLPKTREWCVTRFVRQDC